MNPAHDPLYRMHQIQSGRRAEPALPYDEFCGRLREISESHLIGLRLPPKPVAITSKPQRVAAFSLGRLCVTSNAAAVLSNDEIARAMARHVAGDWGLLCDHDRQQNERALRNQGRLLSVYEGASGTRFYVITDSGWGITTVLLPEDY